MNAIVEERKPEVKKPELKKAYTILPDKMYLAEHARHDFVIDVKPEATIEDITNPEFFAHVAQERNMQPLDRCEVRWEDGTKIVHLRVLWVERAFAKVKVIASEDLGSTATEALASSQRYKLEWKGPTLKWCVIRVSDKQIMTDRSNERAQAIAWIAENDR